MKRVSTGLTPEAWGDRYEDTRGTYQRFTDELHDLLWTLVTASKIDVLHIEKRAKTVESFIEKIHRKGQKYGDPLNEMTDLAGARVIVYYTDDLERVGELLTSEFDVDDANSMNPAQTMEPDKFGYVAPSYVIRLGPTRRELVEWEPFSTLPAEIQVRTIAQHAWAALDHKLRYKGGRTAPPELHRDLSRLSALFELADKEFSDIRRRTQEVEVQYFESVAGGDLDLDLNHESLAAYFGRFPEWGARLRALGVAAGWEDPGIEDMFAFADTGERILYAAERAGFRRLSQLDELLRATDAPWVDRALEEIRERSTERGFAPYAVPADLLAVLLVVRGGVPAGDEINYHTALVSALNDVVAEAPQDPA